MADHPGPGGGRSVGGVTGHGRALGAAVLGPAWREAASARAGLNVGREELEK